MKTTLAIATVSAFSLLIPTISSGADISPEGLKFFEAKIRPILATSCYKCHSQADGKTKGGLALDSKAGWTKGGETGPALVPGDPDQSLLIKAVRYTDEDMQMPPSQSGKQLQASQIADLEAWVKMGAPDPRSVAAPRADIAKIAGGLTEEMKEKTKTHWAYQPIKSPPVPNTKDKTWAKTPVDQFILAKLEEKELTPSAVADKRTLIRRATIDLIGLPPTPQEVLGFVNDESPDAFNKVIDRLLASPQYGERWGRFWLDVARYADTRGEPKKDTSPLSPFAWTYRDYVIKALNSDRPFDQFIKEQIAADQLPTATTQPGTLAALGFITQGDQFQGNRNDIINDQIDVVCKGFMATTVTCARCHDHFFDPVPTRDYYSLHGIFNSSDEPDELPVMSQSRDPKAQAEYIKEQKALTEKGYALVDKEMCAQASKFNRHAETFLISMTHLKNGKRLNDPDVLEFIKRDGVLPENVQAAQRSIQAQVKEAQQQRKMEMNSEMSPGITNKPTKVAAGTKEDKKARKQAKVNFEHPVLGLWNELVRLPDKTFAEQAPDIINRYATSTDAKAVNPLVAKAFVGQKPASLEQVAKTYATVFLAADEAYKIEHDAWKKSAAPNAIFPGLKDATLEQVRGAVFSVTPYLKEDFDDMLRGLSQDMQKVIGSISKQLSAMDLTHPGSMVRANVVHDVKVRNSNVFIRGEAKTAGPEVPRQFLEFIQPERKPYSNSSSGRLQLAEAIASDKNPLTSRVLVNRVWLHHFGEGFVNTPDDLGVMSEAPSHRELCDWLAAKFMADGWSMKQLHKLIMSSAVYQQSSDPNPKFAKADPFNRLLWRANVRRLDFEALRDSLLAIGGKLDLTMFGHPMNIETEPYSPRRTIYGFVDRLNMAEFMKNFDMANAQLSTGKRHQTVVPQQALFRMNSLLVIEQARNVIDRPEFKRATNDNDKIKALYELIFQRWPKPEETKLALTFVHGKPEEASQEVAKVEGEKDRDAKLRAMLEADPKTLNPAQLKKREELKKSMAAKQMAQASKGKGTGKLNELVSDPNAEKVDRTALDAWEKFAHALLMTNEVAYVN
jgi:mono/diheme cytochrome c family protein